MRRVFITTIMCLASALACAGRGEGDPLREGFESPPASAKARTWWHWINGNVTKEGITADLEAMKRVGIREAQIFNVDQGYPEGTASFLTPEWLECFRFAVSEATRLGLEIGFHNGAGWSSSGGPWITPEHAMQTVVFSETHCTGGGVTDVVLLRPAAKFDYYADIAVLAFPTPGIDRKIDNPEQKTLSGHSFKSHLYPDDKPIEAEALIRRESIVDLTGAMSADGTLRWSVPEGKWTILRMGHTPHGTENRPAGIGGRGLECDKLSLRAVDVHWRGAVQPVIDKLGPLAGPGSALTNCLIDSYEVGCNNWTAGFEREFERRRGYDCIEFLPTLAGYYVESGEVTERFLWDFRKTIGDMIADNYYSHFAELCHRHGMSFSVEPYGGPFDCFRVGATGDINMGEFWISDNSYSDSPKLAASIAHLEGRRFVGAESFTSRGGWTNHPATLKSIGDKIWTDGVNRLIFHSYTHQPWNIPPGVTFHMYGLEISRLNTWWEAGRAWMDYIARSQFMLQQGRSVADVLVFAGESSPNDGALRPDIKAMGYDYDEIGVDKVMSLAVKEGKIHTPAGGEYRLMVLPQTAYMTPGLVEKIGELVDAGAVIAGPQPSKSPSLSGFPECDGIVEKLAEKIWGKGGVHTGVTLEEIFSEEGMVPDFSAGESGADLNFIHRLSEDADIYFVASARKESRREICTFRVSDKYPQLWDSRTGEIKEAAVWRQQTDGTISIPINFDPEGSVFVVFQKRAGDTRHIARASFDAAARTMEPLPGLTITEAEYGTFLPDGLVDVTRTVAELIDKGNLTIWANNALADDPAAGSIKELRVEYETDGRNSVARAMENTPLVIAAQDHVRVKVIRAVYGKFPPEMDGVPEKYPVSDVTSHIEKEIAAGNFVIRVDDGLTGDIPSENGPERELRITYSAGGETHRAAVAQGGSLSLAVNVPEAELVSENGKTQLVTPWPGSLAYTTSSGETIRVRVGSVPEPVELTGPWNVDFRTIPGTVKSKTFDTLTSWTESEEEDIRYFSGTATYKKRFAVDKKLLRPGHSLELDLGRVKVIAEVIVNGENIGILWNAPFRISLDGHVHAGINELEIRITNLWPNRLIGDERLEEDLDWGNSTLRNWPDWLSGDAKRRSDRVTFTTWKHWRADSPLQLSGLLGPVVLRPYVRVALNRSK